MKSICYSCKKNLSRGLNQLKGNFKIIYTPKLEKKHKESYKFENDKWHSYLYKKNYDNGLASYSSYVTLTRDRDLDGFLSLKTMRNLVSTSNQLSDYFEKTFKKEVYESVYLFNGRMNIYRPLLRACEKLKISSINVIEFNGNNDQIFNYGEKLPGNKKYLASQMKINWNKNIKKKKDGRGLHYKKEFRQTLMNKNHFKVIQDRDLLPDDWNDGDKNIVYFVSSDDEQCNKWRFFSTFKNQIESIKFTHKILKTRKFKGFKLWIRMHPRLTGLNWPYLNKIIQLKKFKDLNIIYPKEKNIILCNVKKSICSSITSLYTYCRWCFL